MLFNSYTFIFAFLPLTLLGFYLLGSPGVVHLTVLWLIAASFVYYAWWSPSFLGVLIFSCLINASLGWFLVNSREQMHWRRVALVFGLVFNLGMLGYYKYAGFLVQNWNWLGGRPIDIGTIILPIGISFITFQKIAFLVDAYRNEVRCFSYMNFVLFTSFFPQLIAGPIVRYSEVMPQFSKWRNSGERSDNLIIGWSIFCVGLFKKVVVADGCALYADAGYNLLHTGGVPDLATAWTSILAYSFQLYYDFSGYSDMAVGLARMFGVRFPANFHSPYKSSGIIEF